MEKARWRLDREGRILELSPEVGALLGRSESEILGKFCWEAVQGTDDFGRPLCARCPVLARIERGDYEAQTLLVVRGERLRCHGVAGSDGTVIHLRSRKKPNAEEILASLSWATRRMVQAPLRFFQVLEVFLDRLRHASGMEAAELFLADPRQRYLILTAHVGKNVRAFLERPFFAWGEGYPGIVATEKTPIVTHDLEADERYLRVMVKRAGYHTYLSYPLELPHGIIGVLNLASKNKDAGDEALELLELIAPMLASGIYAALTGLGERQLSRSLNSLKHGSRESAIEHLLAESAAFSGASSTTFLDQDGKRISVPAHLPPACDGVESCPAFSGEVYTVRMGVKPCPESQGRPRYCLPVWAGDAVVGVQTLLFARSPTPPTRAIVPLMWLQRLVWETLSAPSQPALRLGSSHWLEVEALGNLKVRVQGRRIPSQDLAKKRAWKLFKLLLAHRGRPLSKEEIAAALWPSEDPLEATRRVPQVVHELRQEIEPHPSQPQIIQTVGEGYAWEPSLAYHLDVDAFEAKIREGDAKKGEEAIRAYLEALDLYRGDFMAEERYSDWLMSERAYLKAQAVRVGERAAAELTELGRAKEALAIYHRLTAIDPDDPYLYENLAQTLERLGRHREAELARAEAKKRLETV